MLPDSDVWPSVSPSEYVDPRRKLPKLSSRYSGKSAKLVKFATTTKVPGSRDSAFLSRSSSVVSVEKGGNTSSDTRDLGS